MMSGMQIQAMQQEAAASAAEEGKVPFIVEEEDLRAWKVQINRLPFPFIGEYVPPRYTPTSRIFPGCRFMVA